MSELMALTKVEIRELKATKTKEVSKKKKK